MFWTKLILVELGPCVTIAILNTALVIYTRKSAQIHPRSEVAARRVRIIYKLSFDQEIVYQEANMTMILFMIVILFFISQGIKLIPDVYEVYSCYGHPEYGQMIYRTSKERGIRL